MWVLPVAIDALADPPGNLARLVRWSLTNDEPTIGPATALELIGRTSSLTFPIAPRLERGVFLDIETADVGVLPGVAVVLLAASWWAAWHSGWRREVAWCSIVGSLWLSGFVAATSITRPLGWWLVQWLEPLGWLTWSAVALVGWRVAVELRPALANARLLPIASLTVLTLAVVAHTIDVVRAHEATTAQDDAVRRLADTAAAAAPGEPAGIVVEGEPLLADATLAGVVAALDRRGVETCVEERLADRFHRHRT
ncbi:MAG: hypothetical protein ACLGHQ_03185, partial [Acidimicrobiia bacterium]